MKKKPMTAAEGAAEERRLWMRRVRQELKEATGADCETCRDILKCLVAYGEGRTERNKLKEGGL